MCLTSGTNATAKVWKRSKSSGQFKYLGLLVRLSRWPLNLRRLSILKLFAVDTLDCIATLSCRWCTPFFFLFPRNWNIRSNTILPKTKKCGNLKIEMFGTPRFWTFLHLHLHQKIHNGLFSFFFFAGLLLTFDFIFHEIIQVRRSHIRNHPYLGLRRWWAGSPSWSCCLVLLLYRR